MSNVDYVDMQPKDEGTPISNAKQQYSEGIAINNGIQPHVEEEADISNRRKSYNEGAAFGNDTQPYSEETDTSNGTHPYSAITAV